jgi:hypothetical protein
MTRGMMIGALVAVAVSAVTLVVPSAIVSLVLGTW